MRSRFVFSTIIVLAVANVAVAQKVEVLEFTGSGKLVGFAPGSMVFVNAQGQRQQVKFAKPGEMQVTLKPPKGQPQAIVAGPPTIDITGELAPEQIRPGLTVVLNCVLDSNHKSAKPATEIKVLDVRPENAGVHADGGPNDEGQPVLIKGIAKSFKKGELTISVPKGNAAPKGTIAIAVAEDAKVTFESHNPAMAPAGSLVEVKGTQLGQGGEVAANTITIKLPAPAAGAAKKRPGAATPKESAKDAPKDGEPKPGEGKPAEGKPEEAAPADAPPGPKKRTKPGKVVPTSQSLPPAIG